MITNRSNYFATFSFNLIFKDSFRLFVELQFLSSQGCIVSQSVPVTHLVRPVFGYDHRCWEHPWLCLQVHMANASLRCECGRDLRVLA